jgi:hypothetical protein
VGALREALRKEGYFLPRGPNIASGIKLGGEETARGAISHAMTGAAGIALLRQLYRALKAGDACLDCIAASKQVLEKMPKGAQIIRIKPKTTPRMTLKEGGKWKGYAHHDVVRHEGKIYDPFVSETPIDEAAYYKDYINEGVSDFVAEVIETK